MRLSTAALLALVTSSLFSRESSCFFKEGDRVGFFGDSITEAKIYGSVTELVFRHFHPQAKVSFVNNGHGGLQLAGTSVGTVVAGDPNVVTLLSKNPCHALMSNRSLTILGDLYGKLKSENDFFRPAFFRM